MQSIYCCIAYAVAALVTIFATCRFFMERLQKKYKQEGKTEDILVEAASYQITPLFYINVAFLTALSALCGYVIGLRGTSILALVELGLCYIALLGAALIDRKLMIIPNIIPIILVGARLVIFVFECIFTDDALGYFISSFLGACLCLCFLVIANKVSKGGIGGGDIKLLTAVGFMSGLYVVFPTLLFALAVCVVYSLIMVAMKKKTMKDHEAFGPFLYLGFVVMCLLKLYAGG